MGCDIHSDSIPEGSIEAGSLDKIAQLCDFKKLKWSTSHQQGCLGLYCGGGLYEFGKALRSEGMKLKHFDADAWLPFEFAKPLKTKKINKILCDASTQKIFTYELLFDTANIGSIPYLIAELTELSNWLSIPKELLALTHKELKILVTKYDLTDESSYFHSSWLDLYSQALFCQEKNGILALSV